MAPAPAINYALSLPAELPAIRPCEHGLVLLKAFLNQPRSSTPPAQPYRDFQGNPLWRVFTQHWAHCVACQEDGSYPHVEVPIADHLDAGPTVRCATTSSR